MCVCSGGVSTPGRGEGLVSQHALRQTPPPVHRMTNFVAAGNEHRNVLVKQVPLAAEVFSNIVIIEKMLTQ